MTWEFTFLRRIVENLQTPFFDGFFKVITFLGEGGVIFFLMAAIMVIFKKTRRAGLVILVGLVLVAGANHFILKPIVKRPRPFLDPTASVDAAFLNNHVLKVWGTTTFNKWLIPNSYSFMSGHTLSAFIFGFGVLFYHPKWYASVPALIFSALMGFSRLYFGFHYLTDVLAGIVTALLTILAIYLINRRFEKTFIGWWNAFLGLFKRKKVTVTDGAEVDVVVADSEVVEPDKVEE